MHKKMLKKIHNRVINNQNGEKKKKTNALFEVEEDQN